MPNEPKVFSYGVHELRGERNCTSCGLRHGSYHPRRGWPKRNKHLVAKFNCADCGSTWFEPAIREE